MLAIILPKLTATINHDNMVEYFLGSIPLNAMVGKRLGIYFQSWRVCMHCGVERRGFFKDSAYCNACFFSLASCDFCQMQPAKCHYHLGTCREPKWGEAHCMITHYVYLSYTSSLKVGVTRFYNIPKRWIDQGAIRAMPLIATSNRLTAGVIEKHLTQYVSDRTMWKKMLKTPNDYLPTPDLMTEGKRLIALAQPFLATCTNIQICQTEPTIIKYPAPFFNTEFTSLNLVKLGQVEGVLLGIKGNYCIMDIGVINLSKFFGCIVKINLE